MKIKSTKKKVAEWLGYVFCEISFLWFEKFDVPYRGKDWRWYHRIVYFIGGKFYSIGCYFYDAGMKD
tara:strand:- start:29 stop:229 length:201 start_codon:yes stop_codon:yes gene_type:complete